MALVKWRPVEREWMDQMRELSRMLEGRWPSSWSAGELGAWTPLVNIFDRGDSVVVEADLPGMKKDAIDVRVQDGTLTLSGERKSDVSTPEAQFFRHEREDGNFCRTFTLPSTVDPNKIDASYKDGVLTLTLQKAESARARRIAIH